jgi:hypothetical protein
VSFCVAAAMSGLIVSNMTAQHTKARPRKPERKTGRYTKNGLTLISRINANLNWQGVTTMTLK